MKTHVTHFSLFVAIALCWMLLITGCSTPYYYQTKSGKSFAKRGDPYGIISTGESLFIIGIDGEAVIERGIFYSHQSREARVLPGTHLVDIKFTMGGEFGNRIYLVYRYSEEPITVNVQEGVKYIIDQWPARLVGTERILDYQAVGQRTQQRIQ